VRRIARVIFAAAIVIGFRQGRLSGEDVVGRPG
jgi:hypothetical protein